MEPRRAPNFDLEIEQLLLDRFLLRRPLRSAGFAHLWAAQDVTLETDTLLRVYVGPGAADDALREAVRRDARRNRRVHHPNVARIHDVHEGDGIIVVALDGHDGVLLSDLLARDGARAYRDVLTGARPLVEGLLHVHESGGEHGRVDADHVLALDDTRWILLPADGTTPARADLPQLGRLLAALLTGGEASDDGRDLNDAAERLHGARTIPALLNQLVADLRAPDAALRPAGIRAVLDRLDQLDEFLAPDPDRAPAPSAAVVASAPASDGAAIAPAKVADPGAPPAPPPASTRLRRTGILLGVGLVVAVVAVAFVLSRPASTNTPGSPVVSTPPPSETPSTTPPTDNPAPDPEAEARRAAAKRDADDALGVYLTARGEADALGAAAWGGAVYEAAATAGQDADRLFLDETYEEAARTYEEAAAAFRRVTETKDTALVQLLTTGATALAAPDAATAIAAFETALRIDPASAQARTGAQRAATLDELHRLLASGAAHEAAGALDFAHADYASAATLDPLSDRAASAYERIKGLLADAEFQAMMSRGLEAYHRGDYAEARTRLLEAQRFRPEAPDAADALRLVEEAELREEVARLREQGRSQESRESWQAAWTTYRQALSIDAAIEFAQEGKTRCETMIRLETHARHYLEQPELLLEPTGRDDAGRLVKELDTTAGLGPRLLDARERLATQLRLATTPLRVALESDELTEIAVFRVGRFGTFRTKTLELLPGTYTVVGRRKGYRDVRLTLALRPGQTGATMRVECTEPIG